MTYVISYQRRKSNTLSNNLEELEKGSIELIREAKAISTGVSLTEIIIKTIIYNLHERFWNTITYASVPKNEDEKIY